VISPAEEESRWAYLLALDEELLVGGVQCSEWATFLIRDADMAFCAGSNLSAILTAVAGIEAHLRYEYLPADGKKMSLFAIVNEAPLPDELREKLHFLRRFHNSWAHVQDPQDDEHLLASPEIEEGAIKETAFTAMRLLREVLYLEQWI